MNRPDVFTGDFRKEDRQAKVLLFHAKMMAYFGQEGLTKTVETTTTKEMVPGTNQEALKLELGEEKVAKA